MFIVTHVPISATVDNYFVLGYRKVNVDSVASTCGMGDVCVFKCSTPIIIIGVLWGVGVIYLFDE